MPKHKRHHQHNKQQQQHPQQDQYSQNDQFYQQDQYSQNDQFYQNDLYSQPQQYTPQEHNSRQQQYTPQQHNSPQQQYTPQQHNSRQQQYTPQQHNYPQQQYTPKQHNYPQQQYTPQQHNSRQQQYTPQQHNYPQQQYTPQQHNSPQQQNTPQQQYTPQNDQYHHQQYQQTPYQQHTQHPQHNQHPHHTKHPRQTQNPQHQLQQPYPHKAALWKQMHRTNQGHHHQSHQLTDSDTHSAFSDNGGRDVPIHSSESDGVRSQSSINGHPHHPENTVPNSANRVDNANAQSIADGDYDEAIIAVFREMRMDLKRIISGAPWEDNYSAFRMLAEEIDLDPNDDAIVRQLYRCLMYNKRFIRDRIRNRESSYYNVPLYKRIPRVEIFPTDNVEHSKMNTPEKPQLIEELQITPKVPHPKPQESQRQKTKPQESPRQKTKPQESPQQKPKLPMPLPPANLVQLDSRDSTNAPMVNWGFESVERTCPRCSYHGKTLVQYKIGKCTWTLVASLVLSGLCLACFWFPFAMNNTKDVMHICRKCRYILGRVPRSPCQSSKEWDWQENQAKTPQKFDGQRLLQKQKTLHQPSEKQQDHQNQNAPTKA